MFGAKQLSVNRDTESVVALTPNIRLNHARLLPLLRPATIGVDAALDLRQPFLMPVDHTDDRNYATNDDGHNRHQFTVQLKQAIDKMIQRAHLHNGILVELTGIEPVASWLQTRRSPS
jgi:hypothetical protein